jgi:hypothetical protein
MTILLTAQAVTNLLGYLQAHLPAKVAALAPSFPVEPDSGQAVVLGPVAKWYMSRQPEGTVIPPAIFVIGEAMEGVNDNPAYYESLHPITLAVLETDPTPDVLTWKLYYWTLALFLCVRDLQQSGGFAGVSTVTWGTPPIVYSPVLTIADRAHFWQDARLNLAVLQGELQ